MISSMRFSKSVGDSSKASEEKNEDDGWKSDFDDDVWGSDFEEESFSQEIEENKLNEDREAALLSISEPNYENNSELAWSETAAPIKSSAIPKNAFSYINKSNTSFNDKVTESALIRRHGIVSKSSMSKNKASDAVPFFHSGNMLSSQFKQDIDSNSQNSSKQKFPNDKKSNAYFNDKVTVSAPIGKPDLVSKGSKSEKNTSDAVPFFQSVSMLSSQIKQQIDLNSQTPAVKKFPGKLPTSAFSFLQTGNNFQTKSLKKEVTDTSYTQLENTHSVMTPPPMPIRPPPVLKAAKELLPSKKPILCISEQSSTELGAGNESSESVYFQLESFQSGNMRVDNINIGNLPEKIGIQGQNSNSIMQHVQKVPSEPMTFFQLNEQLNEREEKVVRTGNSCRNKTSIPPRKLSNTENIKPKLPIKPKHFPREQFERDSNLSKNEKEVCSSIQKLTPISKLILPELSKRKLENTQIQIANSITDNKIENLDSCTVTEKDAKKLAIHSIPIENPKIERTFNQDMHGKESESLNSSQSAGLDSLQDIMNRPILPQKLKSTQRSVSCTSLIQSFKELSNALWNPPEREKRFSADAFSSTKSMRDLKIEKVGPPIKHTNSNTSTDLHQKGNLAFQDIRASESKKVSKNDNIERNIWYQNIDGREAHTLLLNFDHEEAFLVRPSSRPTQEIKYTISVFYKGRVFNIHIRKMTNDRYALGIKKEGEKSFPSILELIKYYQDVPLKIQPTGSSQNIGVRFRVTPPR